MSEKRYSWRNYVPTTFSSLLFLSQAVIGLYLLSEISQIEALAYFGVCLFFVSGLVFGLLPVFEFRKRGGVAKGQSYTQTTRLVVTGVYSVIRHPQYVTFMLFAVAAMLLFQHWIVILLGIPIFPLTYVDLIKADKDAIEKFGGAYEAYMKEVPRANFMIGLLRLFRKRKKQSQTGA